MINRSMCYCSLNNSFICIYLKKEETGEDFQMSSSEKILSNELHSYPTAPALKFAKENKAHGLCKMKFDRDCLQRLGKCAVSCISPQQSCECPADDQQYVFFENTYLLW